MIESSGLDKRKAYILATVVYEYIATAEPVGSQTLTQKYNLGISSATVRNEMAELEAGGYLVQPHTSAGRIPSDAGYRTYVDRLMQPEAADRGRAPADPRRARRRDPRARRDHRHTTRAARAAFEQLGLRDEAAARGPDLQTHPADLAVAAHRRRDRRHVARRRRAEPVRARRRGATRRSHAFLERAERATRPIGCCATSPRARSRTRRKRRTYPDELRGAVMKPRRSPRARANSRPIAAAGAQNLLDQPEFQDLRKLRSILRIVEEQKTLYQIVADAMSAETRRA